MASLTTEQKRRIEENKRKALALRATKQQSGHLSKSSSSILPANNQTRHVDAISSASFPHKNNFGTPSSVLISRPHGGPQTGGNIQTKPGTTTTTLPLVKPGGANSSATLQQYQSGGHGEGVVLSKPATTKLFSSAAPGGATCAVSGNKKPLACTDNHGSPATTTFYKSAPGGATCDVSGNKKPLACTDNHGSPATTIFYKSAKKRPVNWTGPLGSRPNLKSPSSKSYIAPTFNNNLNRQNSLNSPNKTGLASKQAAVKGSCVLISRDRFEVQVSYSSALIEVFKSIPSKRYDSVSKRWSFDLQDYESFMQKAQGFGTQIYVEPLPRAVLQIFREQIKGNLQIRHIAEADLSAVDAELVNTLMPFQRDGINFAVAKNGRILIADDMGLGKTLQALCIACYYRAEWPLLIVTPSSVRFSWRDQILKWVPSLHPQDINVIVSGKVCSVSGQISIISYDLMARRAKELVQKQFKVVIMDESHVLKNFKTARTRAADSILKQANRVVLLSGTPALSRPAEIFTQLSMVDPNGFKYFREFGIRYCAGKEMPWGWDFTGSSNLEELQIILEEHIMIRRLKKDVLGQLPAKVRQMIVLDPGSVKVDKTMKVSHKLVDKMKGTDRHGALLQYFHDTSTAKIPAVQEYVLELLETDKKFLLFAHHQEMLDSVEEVVKKKYSYIRIDGRTNSEQRNYFCNKFQQNEDVKIAILSITAANAGLNLTSASLVVFGELFWNPGILVQAEDRTHRIGQEDSVTVHYLVASKTADDYIWPLVQQKLDVLSKAGLSKDDFSTADTKHLMDRKQRDIMSYFEQSFFEDDIVEGEQPTYGEPSHTNYPASTNSTGQHSEQKSLLSYFKPTATSSVQGSYRKLPDNSHRVATSSGVEFNVQVEDWGDDDLEDLLQDDNFDGPCPKRPRYAS